MLSTTENRFFMTPNDKANNSLHSAFQGSVWSSSQPINRLSSKHPNYNDLISLQTGSVMTPTTARAATPERTLLAESRAGSKKASDLLERAKLKSCWSIARTEGLVVWGNSSLSLPWELFTGCEHSKSEISAIPQGKFNGLWRARGTRTVNVCDWRIIKALKPLGPTYVMVCSFLWWWERPESRASEENENIYWWEGNVGKDSSTFRGICW